MYEALFNNAVFDSSRMCGSVSTVLVSFAHSTGIDMSLYCNVCHQCTTKEQTKYRGLRDSWTLEYTFSLVFGDLIATQSSF